MSNGSPAGGSRTLQGIEHKRSSIFERVKVFATHILAIQASQDAQAALDAVYALWEPAPGPPMTALERIVAMHDSMDARMLLYDDAIARINASPEALLALDHIYAAISPP